MNASTSSLFDRGNPVRICALMGPLAIVVSAGRLAA